MRYDQVELYIQSNEIFVGRKPEIDSIVAVIDMPPPRPIVNIVGPGGIGKTRILARILERLENRSDVLLVSSVVDFYDTINQTELGLLSAIAHSLGEPLAFQPFRNALNEYYSAPPSERYSLYSRAMTLFHECFNELAKTKTVVLLFDTYDQLFAMTPLAEALLGMHFPLLCNNNSCLVVAGRMPIEHSKIIGSIYPIYLAGFQVEDAKEFALIKHELLGLKYSLSDEILAEIIRLSDGRPILIALAIDWILMNANPAQLIALPNNEFEKQQFEEALVTKIINLEHPEDEAILYMAILPRRFDQRLLEMLLNLSDDEGQAIFERLARFSFVKYRPQAKSCSLHDEMREMVNRYIGLPPETARQIREIASGYYETQIKKPLDTQEQNALIAEWVQNSCLLDLDEGFRKFSTQFHLALSNQELDLCRSLLNEVMNLGIFNFRQVDEISLCKAELLIAEYHPKLALNLLTQLAEKFLKSKADKILLGRTLLAIGHGQALLGEMLEAVNSLEQAQACFVDSHDIEYMTQAARALGDVHYWAGQYAKSVPYLEDVLVLSQEVSDKRSEVSALGILSNLRRRQGFHDEALELCGQALRIVEQFSLKSEAPHALRNLANVMRDMRRYSEAAELYEQAITLFRESNERLGLARTLSEYAWCAFVMSNDDYELAKSLAEESIALKEEFNFNNELATTYHTLFEICLREEGSLESYQIIEKVYQLASRYNDGYMTFDALHHLVLLDYELGSAPEKIQERVMEMDRLAQQGYKFLLFQGRATVLLGHIAFDRKDLRQAMDQYTRGYKMIAEQGGTATGIPQDALLQKELKPLKERIDLLSAEERQWFCDAILQWWKTNGLEVQYPALLSLCT